MKKVILMLLSLVAIAGCGKKQDDPGAQFSIKSMGDFRTLENGTPGTPIPREDENAGPSYKVEGNLAPIEYFDKKLVCGPVVINARRALKTDLSFLSFKVSEAEFHGVNQLPEHAECVLSVTSANGNGSTVTKNSAISLKFDSSPALTIRKEVLAPKTDLGLASADTVPMEYYEITNPFSYTVAMNYRSTRYITAVGYFSGGVGMSANIYPNFLEFDATNIEYTGSFETGYKFKIPPNSMVKLYASARITSSSFAPACQSNIGGPLLGLSISTVGESGQPLVQASKFDFSSEDFSPGRILNVKQLSTAPLHTVRPLRSQSNCPPPGFTPG